MQKQAPLWNVLQNISPALCKAYARKKKEKKKNRALRNVSEDMLTTQYVGLSERLLGICKEVQVKCPPA